MRIALKVRLPSTFRPPLSISPSSTPFPTLKPFTFNSCPTLRSKPLRFCFHGRRAMTAAAAEESPAQVQVRDKIWLTQKEELIFDRLLQVVRHFGLGTQLRVAGGWVRDKLLGKECNDIDIAIDNMLGREFCEKVKEYLSNAGEEAHGIGVIKRNPDQSKHLETATMRLFDLWIDFVNLRSEDYTEDSRIPTMRFGTAKEDAYRRDLTINSLFYNINTNSVEDFTARGIEDLKSGKIVTPLPPKETFLDDPLRVLRAIRFGARFGFTLAEELKKAASDDDVKLAIAGKISRERVGIEIDLMVSGSQPVKAIQCIADLQLFWVVFGLPPQVDPSISEKFDRDCIAYMEAAWNLMQLVGQFVFSDEQRRLALYAALFVPLRETIYRDNKSKKVPVVNWIFHNSLKLKAKDAETVINVHNATKKFVFLIPFIISNNAADLGAANGNWGNVVLDVPSDSKLRILAGLILRDIKEFWRVALLASMLLYPTEIEVNVLSANNQLGLDERLETFKTVERRIMELGLEKVWEMKPLVNGKEIMDVLQLKTGGPLVRQWQQKLLEWQLAHPSGTAEECLDWMRETHSKRPRLE